MDTTLIIGVVGLVAATIATLATCRKTDEPASKNDAMREVRQRRVFMTHYDPGVDAIVTSTGRLNIQAKSVGSQAKDIHFVEAVREAKDYFRRRRQEEIVDYIQEEIVAYTVRWVRKLGGRYAAGRRANRVLQVWSALLP